LYGTTEGFLRYFGLKNLHDLPILESGDPRQALVAPTMQASTGSE
jgi:chromosome segregation and condensation protein ScpB